MAVNSFQLKAPGLVPSCNGEVIDWWCGGRASTTMAPVARVRASLEREGESE